MPFKGVDVMDVKKEFVLKALDGRVVFTELCREYGISTKCGYKWRQRFLEEGYCGLEEHSRKPLSNSRGGADGEGCGDGEARRSDRRH
jgi:transposase-like protein